VWPSAIDTAHLPVKAGHARLSGRGQDLRQRPLMANRGRLNAQAGQREARGKALGVIALDKLAGWGAVLAPAEN